MFLRSMFQAGALPVLEQALSFAEARHKVLATNVANAETPGYRRRDLNVDAFEKQLAEAVEKRNRNPGEFRFDREGFDVQRDPVPFSSSAGRAGMLRHDRNNVDIHREMALVGKNALFHNTVARLLKRKYGGIKQALSGARAGGV